MKRTAAATLALCLLFSASCVKRPGETVARPVPPGPSRLLGVDPIEDPLPIRDRNTMRYPDDNDELDPLRVLVSRGRYWAEDGHMDVVVQLEEAVGALRIRIVSPAGDELAAFDIDPVPSDAFIFYPQLPVELLDGGRAEIEVAWVDGDAVRGTHREAFRVERHGRVAREGSVRIEVPNPDGITLAGLPVTVGVPFPRGALADTAHLRLIDEDGRERPLQARETARWSKHGSVKWVLCDFTVDLDGSARTLRLEYGPRVRRTAAPELVVRQADGFPSVDAGRIRLDEGLWFDATGDGRHVKVLEAGALSGAFVEHEDGRVYRAPIRDRYEVEEIGPVKTVIRREGWYREPGGDSEFCLYVTRYVLHRNSPLMRIFHTWIFTGDGNRDRIANMGWEFRMDPEFEPRGFLTSFEEDRSWVEGDFLLQWDYAHYDVVRGGRVTTEDGGRAAGVAAAEGPGARLYFGAKDFWQSYPSELEFAEGSFRFHNWPRHNRPAGHTFDGELASESGLAALPSAARYAQGEPGRLTRSEWSLNAIQHRYAHEGEVLDFRLPDAFGVDPILASAGSHLKRYHEIGWDPGDVETANAQGVSRTEEIWLVLTPADTEPAAAEQVFWGLNQQTLNAVVDPVWVAASGAFFEMHHQDWERFPEEERAYELMAHFLDVPIEYMGIYGMWIHGGIPAWDIWNGLERMEPGLYRAYRKVHQRWPYSWKPYARSGDFHLYRLADRAVRHLIDGNYSYYATEEVDRLVGPYRHVRKGRWDRGPLIWGARSGTYTRHYTADTDYVWYTWFLTGYHRALDNALDFAEQMKIEEPDIGLRGPLQSPGRPSWACLKAFTDHYEATFDPWFLVAAHRLAGTHREIFRKRDGDYTGRLWKTGDREFARFSGDEEYEQLYLSYAQHHTDPRQMALEVGYHTGMPAMVYAWELTDDDHYLRRILYEIDYFTAGIQDGERVERRAGYPRLSWDNPPSRSQPMGSVDTLVGWPRQGNFTLYYPSLLRWFPNGLWAAARAPEGLEPKAKFDMRVADASHRTAESAYSPVIFRKTEPEAMRVYLAPLRSNQRFEIIGPDGNIALSGGWPGHPDWAGESDRYGRRHFIVLPPEAPVGEYRLRVLSGSPDMRRGDVRLPLTESDTPEVIRLAPGEPLGRTFLDAVVWFKVPDGIDRFWMEVPAWGGAALLSLRTGSGSPWPGVWNPDGRRVYSPASASGRRVDFEVKPGHAGRFWRLSMPTPGTVLDPRIPPVFAANPARWFLPVGAEEE